ncbi:EcsC family protein [Rapidithrix thailandica]|uniref:EcsC family protein n=1 Tax=Rapidithrix thailandica TaxID=413964 RepID=A0AAW9SBD0_9BACT
MKQPQKEEPSNYELQEVKLFEDWKNEKKVPVFLQTLQRSIAKAGQFIKKIPGVEAALNKTNQTFLEVWQDLANWEFNQTEIYSKFIQAGHQHIVSAQDIATLDLEEIEEVLGDVCNKYKTLASVKQKSSNTLSSMPTDIIALVTLNQQAIGEYATHFGFDISLQQEKLFALNILEYASTMDEAAKEQIKSRLIKNALEMTGSQNREVDKPTFIQMLKKLSTSVSIQLLKAKVGQLIPIHGAVIGTGFNAYFTTEVCDIAHWLYKQRFLAEKYGTEVFELKGNNVELLNEENQASDWEQ